MLGLMLVNARTHAHTHTHTRTHTHTHTRTHAHARTHTHARTRRPILPTAKFTLSCTVQGDCSGDYKRFLLEIVGE